MCYSESYIKYYTVEKSNLLLRMIAASAVNLVGRGEITKSLRPCGRPMAQLRFGLWKNCCATNAIIPNVARARKVATVRQADSATITRRR